MNNYTDDNSKIIDGWIEGGWEWGIPISREAYIRATNGELSVLLTPTRFVPREWFPEKMTGLKILGLASGGAQQMPVFCAHGADCTIMDYSQKQLESERKVSEREGYSINIVRADMTKPFPFEDESFDLIFHPVSNCYVRDVCFVWNECFRVLKKGGTLLAGFDNGINLAYNEEETELTDKLPYDPTSDPALYEKCIKGCNGIQFSHPIEDQIGGQLRAGFILRDIYEDTNGAGILHEHGVPTMYATKSVKQ